MAPHSVLSLAFVSVVYFVATVNSFPAIKHLKSIDERKIDHIRDHHFVEHIEQMVPQFHDYVIRSVSLSEYQIFSGTFYFLKIYRSLKHDDSQTIEECYVCIWKQPLLHKLVVIVLQCKPVDNRLRMSKFVGWHREKVNAENVAAAEFGMIAINRKTNCYYMSLITEISSVLKKIRRWTHYIIKVSIIKTDCKNVKANLRKQFNQCHIKAKAHEKRCEIIVKSKMIGKTRRYRLVYDTCN